MTSLSKYIVCCRSWHNDVGLLGCESVRSLCLQMATSAGLLKRDYPIRRSPKVIIREETWKPGPEIVVREPREGRGFYVGSDWRTW